MYSLNTEYIIIFSGTDLDFISLGMDDFVYNLDYELHFTRVYFTSLRQCICFRNALLLGSISTLDYFAIIYVPSRWQQVLLTFRCNLSVSGAFWYTLDQPQNCVARGCSSRRISPRAVLPEVVARGGSDLRYEC